MELIEAAPGVFVLQCAYGERHVPKRAGFRWHPGERCRSADCAACAQGLGSVWRTEDPLTALALVEHASPELGEALFALAGDAGSALREEHRRRARARKVEKLQRLQNYERSLARDARIDVPRPAGLDYLPYQRAAIAYALARPSTLIADEMGLGKTIEALGVINADDSARRVLIVCPATLKLNWQRECERWLVGSREVGVAGRTWPADADVVIVNYDILGKWERELAGCWDVLVADECHFVKNSQAKRSKRLYALDARRRLFLTGTPILNRPIELYAIAAALDAKNFGHFWDFANRFCNPMRTNFGWDFSGAANLDQLHELLRGTIMIRRAKADVLQDLPPKRRQVIELSAEKLGALVRTETEAWQEHKELLAELRRRGADGDGHPAAGKNAASGELEELRRRVNLSFGELAKLRRQTALAKVPLVVEHLENALEAAPKIVVFAHHRDVVEALASPFGAAAVTLRGGDPIDARQAAVDRFQQDPSCRLFVGSITAAGLGLTLTASSHVVFAELDWVPANLTQAEDRTHRIGQRASVLVQHLVLQGSLDARMVRSLIHKQKTIDQVVDGGAQTELFEREFTDELIAAAERAAAERPPAG